MVAPDTAWGVRAALVLALGTVACTTSSSRGASSDAAPGPQAFPVRWAQVREMQGGEDWVDVEAVLNSPERAPLGFKVAGRIATLECPEGSIVTPDPARPIATLETGDYEIALRGAEATLQRAEAALRRARGVGVPHARRELDRGRQVADAGVIAQRDLQGLEAQLDDMQAQAGEAAAAVAQASVLVEQARAALADTTILAPFRGLVVKKMAAVGQLVGQGTPVCVVERTDALDALASLPGRLLPSIDGTRTPRVTVRDAGGVEIDGTLEALAWAGDLQTGTFPVKVRVDNAAGTFRSGMQAIVRLALRRGNADPDETLFAVPLDALVASEGTNWLFAPTDETRTAVARVPVEVRELGRDGVARVRAAFPGPLLVVSEGQHMLLDADAESLPVSEVAPP